MENVLLAEHQETDTMCSTGETLEMTASSTDIQWLGTSHPAQFACGQPIQYAMGAASPGATSAFSCQARDGSRFTGTTTYVSDDSIAVAGQARPAWRLLFQGTFVGPTRGTVVTTEDIDKVTGLILFQQRSTNIGQTTLIGEISYHEAVTFHLDSLTPRT